MRRKRIVVVTVISVVVIAALALALVWLLERSGTVATKSIDVVVSPRAPSDDPCAYPQPTDRELDQTEAVAAAECFVIQNGYTDLPPTTDKSKITPENVHPMTDEFGMSLRHDSLERQATTVVRDEAFWGGSWMVMFRMKGPNADYFYGKELEKTSGRAVVMNFYGKNIRIQHSPYSMMPPGARVISP
jgi:hypothetical protein